MKHDSLEIPTVSRNDYDDNMSFSKPKPAPPQFERDRNRRAMKKAIKQVKTNRDERSPRRKDWTRPDAHGDDEAEDAGFERIMPRGERERRVAVTQAARRIVAQASEHEEAASGAETALSGERGTVIEVSSGLCRVDVDGERLLCSMRGSLSAAETGQTNVVACGDEVIVERVGEARGVVVKVLPRRSALARPDVFNRHLSQVIVANVEQLLIVASWREPHLWTELIDRYLISAARDNLTPLVCINKIDLAADRSAPEGIAGVYRELGIAVLMTSAHTGEGIDALRERLHGRSTALAGLSGVGKSSLLTMAEPGLNLKVGAVSDYHMQGQHTTTQVSMWRLAHGGWVVDTPGIREFGLSGLAHAELVSFFPDLEAHAGGCHFANCTHRSEPSCAVRAAAETGYVAGWRYKNYVKLYGALGE
ncbi:MAG: ribosome small subunit-dependent GTPase A [Anaerolineae bacterium]|nr:ribosome small subunit-dependent GTPase A [Anaerolineae bacterium]